MPQKTDLVDITRAGNLADVIKKIAELVRKSLFRLRTLPDVPFSVIASASSEPGTELQLRCDLIRLWNEVGETTGIQTNQGMTVNRITNHEYYCKVRRADRFPSLNTESVAYRVDLDRLRGNR
jgi:hypothetical protein